MRSRRRRRRRRRRRKKEKEKRKKKKEEKEKKKKILKFLYSGIWRRLVWYLFQSNFASPRQRRWKQKLYSKS